MEDLSLSDVSYSINSNSILEKISFSVGPGDWLCIAGCNGSGKSTLLRLMAGLIGPSHGCIQFGGTAFKDLPDKDKKISGNIIFKLLIIFILRLVLFDSYLLNCLLKR